MKQMWEDCPPPPRGEGLYPHGHLMNQLDPVATDFVLASNLEDRARPGADGGLTLEEAPATVALG
jgi:hypothetical protein